MASKSWLVVIAIWSFLTGSSLLSQAAIPSQLGVFRPQTGQWYLDFSGNRAWDRCGPDGCLGPFGAPGDLPVVGDWSGNGIPKIGIFRPVDGRWYLDRNGNSAWDGCGTDACLGPFGSAADRPVTGDWTGSGTVRFGVFRPATGEWFFDLNGNGQWDGCTTDGCLGPFGAPDDLPVAGDIDGDRITEFGVFRPSTGGWYFDLDHNGFWSGCGADGCFDNFGAPGDRPVLTDLNGDGTLELGVFRPATSQWYFDLDHNGAWSGCGADGCFGHFGGVGDLPVIGSWDRTAGPGDPLNYFPLTVGNTWTFQGTYRDSDGFSNNYQNTVAVTGTRVIDGITTLVVSMSNPEDSGPIEQYLLKEGRGLTNWGNNDPRDTITPRVVAYQEVIFPPESGISFGQYALDGVDLGDDLDGDGVNELVTVSSRIAQSWVGGVTLSTGLFGNCIKIVNTLSLNGALSGIPGLTYSGTVTTSTWYAPQTGPIKSETVLSLTTSSGQGFSSVTTEELTTGAIVAAPRAVTLSNVLTAPWGLAFLPDHRMLVTQKGGSMVIMSADGNAVQTSVSGLPVVEASGQGGLLDVALDPDFTLDPWVYWTYTEPGIGAESGLFGTAVARGRLVGNVLQNVEVIYRQVPKVGGFGHFGSRLAFRGDKTLFVTLGERQLGAPAQDVTTALGKVIRINRDGTIPADNPAIGGARQEIWSYGHRNPQGAAIRPGEDVLWINEHGPQGGDELNKILAGGNYGWPLVSYGCNYGDPVGEACRIGGGTHAPNYIEPVSTWVPTSIAPAGLIFYTGSNIPEWQGSAFMGALAGTALWRIVLSGDTEVARERLFAELGERIRDVEQGPDGWIYLLTDSGKLMQVRN